MRYAGMQYRERIPIRLGVVLLQTTLTHPALGVGGPYQNVDVCVGLMSDSWTELLPLTCNKRAQHRNLRRSKVLSRCLWLLDIPANLLRILPDSRNEGILDIITCTGRNLENYLVQSR